MAAAPNPPKAGAGAVAVAPPDAKLNADVGADVDAPKPPNAGGAWDVAVGAPNPPNEAVGATAWVAGCPKAGAAPPGVDVAAPKAEGAPPKEKLLPNAAAERDRGRGGEGRDMGREDE